MRECELLLTTKKYYKIKLVGVTPSSSSPITLEAACFASIIHLIVSLLDNWDYLGGVPQYLKWYGIADTPATRDAFFSDPRLKQAYKNWVAHLLNRVNSYTGVAYRDDPTILGWQLCNECQTAGNAPLFTGWVAEMSSYIKSIDSHHLVNSGDTGLFSRGGNDDAYGGDAGQDFDAILALPSIDFGNFHSYPEYFWDWATGAPEPNSWATATFIPDHYAVGALTGKPVVMDEFGMTASGKGPWYEEWTRKVEAVQGAGWAFWESTGRMANGAYPVDTEGFEVHLGTTLSKAVLYLDDFSLTRQ